MATTKTLEATCCDPEAACWCVPAEFVRPRFFYGQRLGVVDFTDQLWYHAGKQRFHNLRAHGPGVLCGLRAERYEIPGEAASTLLRIRAGAALDACGREVVVGVDHCIDVAPWLADNAERPEVADWLAGDPPRSLCVGLRYRECPSDPVPAPRDPCGCDAGGCEYGRVREGFELALFTLAEVEAMPPAPSFPTADELAAALAAGDDPAAALRGATAGDCPPAESPGWLWLACFEAVFDGDAIVDLAAVDNEIPERSFLLATTAIQSLVLELSGAASAAGLTGTGPAVTSFSFAGSGADAGEVTLELSGPVLAETVDAGAVRLRRLDPGSAWVAVDPDLDSGDTVAYTDGPPAAIVVTWQNDLQPGLYRLTLAGDPAEPIVDATLAPLRPAVWGVSFELVDDGGTLVLADPPIPTP